MTANPRRFVVACGAVLVAALGLQQPMAGLLLVASAILAQVLSRRLGLAPWLALAAKLALLIAVTVVAPILFGGELIPGAPDQYQYIDAADRVAAALRESVLSVDYEHAVGMGHNLSYGALLGWLSFLNGSASVLLVRLLNVFLSMLLAALGYLLVRTLYPGRPKLTWLLFLGLALLPSANAYAMFVLRDVLIAVMVMFVACGLVTSKYGLVLCGLALAYPTRLQLFFLLLAAAALYVAFRIVRRLARFEGLARGIATVGFVVAGYWTGPRFLPLGLGGTGRLGVSAFAVFLTRFVPSLLGLGFLYAGTDALELSRSALGVTRFLLPDTWAVPALFLIAATRYRRSGGRWREFYLWVLALTVVYTAGYWIAYGGIHVRLLMPLYPLLLVASAALFAGREVEEHVAGQAAGCSPPDSPAAI